MSSFKFKEPTALNIKDINFTGPEWSSNIITNMRLNMLLRYYLEGKYHQVINMLNLYIEETEIQNKFKAYVRMRHAVLNLLTAKKIQTLSYANEMSLDYEPFDNVDHISIYENNKIYRFTRGELLRLYQNNIFKISANFLQSFTLTALKNPYTNKPFTLKTHVIIYDYLAKTGTIPTYIINFKNCYFDLKRYTQENHQSLCRQAFIDNLNNMPASNFMYYIRAILHNSPYVWCKYCFEANKCIKEIFFTPVLLLLLNDQYIYNYGQGLTEFIKIALKHNLLFNPGHHRIHKKRVSRLNNLNPIDEDDEDEDEDDDDDDYDDYDDYYEDYDEDEDHYEDRNRDNQVDNEDMNEFARHILFVDGDTPVAINISEETLRNLLRASIPDQPVDRD